MSAIALYAKASPDFADKLAQSLHLLQTAELEHGSLVQASSLGAEDMVVTHLLHTAGIEAGIFMLDTGRLHPETLALRERLEQRYHRTVDVYRPDEQALAVYLRDFGEDAIYRSVALRKLCCDIRKMAPLERALAGHNGWITGLRREQSSARAVVDAIEHQRVQVGGRTVDRVKLNPLARWTWGDVWHYIALHEIPFNPLHDQFFPSIGCAPCTRAVTLGEDPRSGRWWWEDENLKECGLHVAKSTVIPIREVTA
ncbi:MAG: phosphoadenylyl-sulfate reductase [Ramlibacter sp.]|jgi:phosphoadenosine phosphosulfate reductase|nr:phosphoadenylyl-sulfate reductase [Ramlibacter sp.]